jgi:hypothetical protein
MPWMNRYSECDEIPPILQVFYEVFGILRQFGFLSTVNATAGPQIGEPSTELNFGTLSEYSLSESSGTKQWHEPLPILWTHSCQLAANGKPEDFELSMATANSRQIDFLDRLWDDELGAIEWRIECAGREGNADEHQ